MTKMFSKWNYPTTVRFGAGRIKELPDALAFAGIKRPLFVTDPGPGEAAGRRLDAEDPRRRQGPLRASSPTSSRTRSKSNLTAGIAAFKKGKHDGVIAFGGGSALDLGKLIAFQAGQTRPVWDFEDIGDWWTRANSDAIAPIVAVPTTAGTGSEVGRAGVLTNEATHTKKIIFHPKLLPAIVIADPELTIGMPPFITVGTGMDALAHCLEAYSAAGYHPMADGVALEGMRLVFENLPKAAANGKDITARANMMARRRDGRHRLPEGARRHPFAVASDRRALRHPSRHDQRRLHALRARLQPRRRSRRGSRAPPPISASRAASTALRKRS